MQSVMSTYLETPLIHRPNEVIKSLPVEVLCAQILEALFIEDLPTSAMRHPAHDIAVLWIRKDHVKPHGKCHHIGGRSGCADACVIIVIL